jgi:iron complex outermembrane receptor protein
VWDISVARDTGRIRPYLRATNVTNTGYQEIQNVQVVGRGVIGGVEIVLSRKPQ